MSGSLPMAPTAGVSYHANYRQEIVPLVTATGGTLVDVGGGLGFTAAKLKELGKADRIGVIDLFAPDEGGPALDFAFNGNLENPEFLNDVIVKEGPFTTILLLDVLEHLVDPWAIVARMHEALVPGGEIVASLPNVRHFSALGPLLLKNQWQLADKGILDRTHLRFFVKGSAVEMLTGSGLVLEEVRANPSGGRKVKWIRRLTLGMFNSFTDQQYLIRVRKPAVATEVPVKAAA